MPTDSTLTNNEESRFSRLVTATETVAGGLWNGLEGAVSDAWQNKVESAKTLGGSAVIAGAVTLLQPEAGVGKLALEGGLALMGYAFVKDAAGVAGKTWDLGKDTYYNPANAESNKLQVAHATEPLLRDTGLAMMGGVLGSGSVRLGQALRDKPVVTFGSLQDRPEFDNAKIQGMFQQLKDYHQTSFDHSNRVAKYSDMIAEQMGMSRSERELLNFAAKTHDIGKLDIPLRILDGTGKLSTEDLMTMQGHARQSLVRLNESLKPGAQSDVPRVAALHHEDFNGNGYFMGLSGQDIPKLTRVITVADVFDALSSVRSYKPRSDINWIQDFMMKNKGVKFDPEVVDAFMQIPAHKVASVLGESTGWTKPSEFKSFKGQTWEGLMKSITDAKGITAQFKRIYETAHGN